MGNFCRLFAAGAAAWLMTVVVASVDAQTVYAPPRIQYGPTGDIFYSGSDPAIQRGGPDLYAPKWVWFQNDGRLIPPPEVRRASSLDRSHWRYGSPFYREGVFIFSDSYPNIELGQFGFNQDDVRNEAYAKLPRVNRGAMPEYMTQGSVQQWQAAQQLQTSAAPPTARNPREKAIPLISMARSAKRQGNHQLVDALLYEAAKYDPTAAAHARATLK